MPWAMTKTGSWMELTEKHIEQLTKEKIEELKNNNKWSETNPNNHDIKVKSEELEKPVVKKVLKEDECEKEYSEAKLKQKPKDITVTKCCVTCKKSKWKNISENNDGVYLMCCEGNYVIESHEICPRHE